MPAAFVFCPTVPSVLKLLCPTLATESLALFAETDWASLASSFWLVTFLLLLEDLLVWLGDLMKWLLVEWHV